MNRVRKWIAVLMILSFTIQVLPFHKRVAAAEEMLPAVKNFKVVKGVDYFSGEENLGHNGTPANHVSPKYSATFSWDEVTGGHFTDSRMTYVVTVFKDDGTVFSTLETGNRTITFYNLPSGSIYHASIYAKETEFENGLPVPNSFIVSPVLQSPLYFATNIDFTVENMGNDVVRLEWDRMLYGQQDVNYTIYYTDGVGITDPDSYTRRESIDGWNITRILSSLIGVPGGYGISDDGKITIDLKLSRKAGEADPDNVTGGALWYFKIVPEINYSRILANDHIRVLYGSTRILVSPSRISGELWRLNWTQVIPYDEQPVRYHVWRKAIIKEGGVVIGWGLPELLSVIPTTEFYVPAGTGTEYVYYIEVLQVPTPFGESQGLISNEVELVQTIPYTPQTPRLISYTETGNVDIPGDFRNIEQVLNGNVTENVVTGLIIDRANPPQIVRNQTGSDTVEQIWEMPKLPGTNVNDEEVYYDIWIVENPLDLQNAPTYSDVVMSDSNFIRYTGDDADKGRKIGYRFKFSGLKPNTTYYMKVAAKKQFIIYDEEEKKIKPWIAASSAAVKTVVTLTKDSINQPEAISKPPLRVKIKNIPASAVDEEGRLVQPDLLSNFSDFAERNRDVDATGVTLEWRNHWYEVLSPADGKWYSMWYETRSTVGQSVYWDFAGTYNGVDQTMPGVTYGLVMDGGHRPRHQTASPIYREINHQDVVYTVKYAEYKEEYGGDISKLTDVQTLQGTGITIANGKVECRVDGLKPNTMYAFWVIAVRQGNDSPSMASDLVVATTRDDSPDAIETPAVPVIDKDKSEILATEVFLSWVPRPGLTYVIRYGTEDDVERGTEIVVQGELEWRNGNRVYHITGLTPATTYYFWLQAVKDENHKSDFSDSVLMRTLEYQPPDPPVGFGVKNTPDAIGKDYITFEWIGVPNLEYILEVSTESEFKEPMVFHVNGPSGGSPGETLEYKVTGLVSNRWYYARLYSFDPESGLKSAEPAPKIGNSDIYGIYYYYLKVKTLRSNDEYDSDVEEWEVITGDIIVSREPTYDDSTWYMEILGVNADRFAQMIYERGTVDYKINMIKPSGSYSAERYALKLTSKALMALSQYGSHLTVDFGDMEFTIRPGIFEGEPTGLYRDPQTVIQISMKRESSSTSTLKSNESFATRVYNMTATAAKGSEVRSISELKKPYRMAIRYAFGRYGRLETEQASGGVYDPQEAGWKMYPVKQVFDKEPAGGAADSSTDGALVIDALRFGKTGVIIRSGRQYFTDLYRHENRYEIEELLRKATIKSIPSGLLKPDQEMSREEGLKLVLDGIGYDYKEDYAAVGRKSGITRFIDMENLTGGLTREEYITMLARIYEIKTRSRFESEDDLSYYSDYTWISEENYKKVAFSVARGIIAGVEDNRIDPRRVVTRAEALVMLKRVLDLMGY